MRRAECGVVRAQEQLAADVYRLVMESPQTAATFRPGQFLHIRAAYGSDPFLRRPFSPSRVEAKAGTIEIIYRVVGRGTERFTDLRAGDRIDILGPLGSTFTLTGNLLMVGGGVGIAPLLYAVQMSKPERVTVIIGGRNASELFWRDLFTPQIRQLLLATDDGSLGFHGYTPTLAQEVLRRETFDRVLTCGPDVMMRKVAAAAAEVDIPCEVSLERRMGCGTGGCLACVCDTPRGGHKKVCTDGPVFDSREVVL